MTDENEVEVLETQIRVEALDGDSLKESTNARLTVEGRTDLMLALGDGVLALLQMGYGAQIDRVTDENGQDIAFGPEKVDPLDTGDGAGE